MKLESLKLKNFLDFKMDNDKMSVLNGGLADAVGTVTPAGSGCGYGTTSADYYQMYSYNYGYDAIRTNADGSTYTTYHNRTNVVKVTDCTP